MMEGTAGRSLLQEMFDEALSFRRALANLRQHIALDEWWFSIWQPPSVCLSSVFTQSPVRYQGLGLRDLCDQLHSCYRSNATAKHLKRIAVVMLVPYPPGIPLIMPGERFTESTRSIIDYLASARTFDSSFPGFVADVHGLQYEDDGNGRCYTVDCIKG